MWQVADHRQDAQISQTSGGNIFKVVASTLAANLGCKYTAHAQDKKYNELGDEGRKDGFVPSEHGVDRCG